MEESESICIVCRNENPINKTNNRLLTEGCGHMKCMKCLFIEEHGCSACLLEEIKVEFENNEDNRKNITPISHIIEVNEPSKSKSYLCTTCNKSFGSKRTIRYHKYCNGQKKPFQCTECDKTFVNISHYQYHMRVHKNEKPYQCNECGRSFFQLSQLKRHQLVHTKERNYRCQICNKAFNNRVSLRKHGLLHSQVMPYECKNCSKMFRDQSNYKKHVRSHSLGMGPNNEESKREEVQCPHCDQVFGTKKDMNRHISVHSDKRPHRCKICNKTFRRKDNLDRHIRNTHPHQQSNCAEYITDQATNILKTMNPLPPIPQEILNQHINNTEQIIQANNARESVIFCPKPKPVIKENEYVHKIRKANKMASQRNSTLPPIDEEKVLVLAEKGNFDVGMPSSNMEVYKKILCERVEGKEGDEEEKKDGHWRNKLKYLLPSPS